MERYSSDPERSLWGESRPVVLIVDKDSETSQSLSQCLHREGFTASYAQSGTEALVLPMAMGLPACADRRESVSIP